MGKMKRFTFKVLRSWYSKVPTKDSGMASLFQHFKTENIKEGNLVKIGCVAKIIIHFAWLFNET